MRTISTGSYHPLDLITFAWVVNFALIDTNIHMLAPSLTTDGSVLKPILVTVELEPNKAIKAAHIFFSNTAMVSMDSYEAEAVMRFTASMSYNGLSWNEIEIDFF